MMAAGGGIGLFSILPLFSVLIYLTLSVLGIYCLILFIKLAHRGIKALDIYISEKNNQR